MREFSYSMEKRYGGGMENVENDYKHMKIQEYKYGECVFKNDKQVENSEYNLKTVY